jgi:hypothetical protein
MKTESEQQLDKYPPDAGNWIFDNSLQKWIENDSISQEYYDSYMLKRDVSINTKATFYVDGFPRQANTTLRTLLLNTFSDIAMPDPLMHNVALAEKAILDKKIIFYTLRNPHDSILSLISMKVNQWADNFVNVNHYINYYIRHCLFIKHNINNITVISFEEIVQINNDFYNENIHNNKIIQFISTRYNLKINSHDFSIPFLKSDVLSTSNKEIESLYLNNSYYKTELEKANELYKEIIELLLKQNGM